MSLTSIVLMHKPDHIEMLMLRAYALVELRLLNEARADLQHILRLQPEHARAYVCRGWISHLQWAYDAAIQDATRGIEFSTDRFVTSHSYVNRSDAHFELLHFAESLEDANRAIETYPTYAAGYVSRARISILMGRYDAALSDATRAVELSGGMHVNALLNQGLALFRQGKTDEAIYHYNQSLAHQPNPNVLLHRAYAYLRLRNWLAVQRDIDAAWTLSDEFNRPRLRLTKAYFYQVQGNYDEAGRILDEIIRVRPEYADAYSNRAYLLAEMGQLDNALRDTQQAMTLVKMPRYYLFGLRGYLYFLQGRFSEAAVDFQNAMNLHPYYWLARVGLAVTQHAMGHVAEARNTWRDLVAIDGRYASIEALIDDYHPAEAFVSAARKVVAELPSSSKPD